MPDPVSYVSARAGKDDPEASHDSRSL